MTFYPDTIQSLRRHVVLASVHWITWGAVNRINIQNLFRIFQHLFLCDFENKFWISPKFVSFKISLYIMIQDEWLLSLTKTWTISISIQLSFLLQLHMLSDPLWFPTSFANVGKPSPTIVDLAPSCFETPFVVFTRARPQQFPGACRARRFNPVFLFQRVCILSVVLSPHLRKFVCILAWVPHQFPGVRITAVFFSRFSRDWGDCSSSCGRFSSSHSTGCASPDSWVSTSPSTNSLAWVLPSVNLHWKLLLVVSLTWHSASWSDQKEN